MHSRSQHKQSLLTSFHFQLRILSKYRAQRQCGQEPKAVATRSSCSGSPAQSIPIMSEAKVTFWFLVDGSVFIAAEIKGTTTLAALLQQLQKQKGFPASLYGVQGSSCKFYTLPDPVPMVTKVVNEEEDGKSDKEIGREDETVVNACLAERESWSLVPQSTHVKSLANHAFLNGAYLCLVIETPRGLHDRAVDNLMSRHALLFEALHIHLESFRSWSSEDVTNNLKGGHYFQSSRRRTEEAIRTVEAGLAAKRTCYDPTSTANANSQYLGDFETARRYRSNFNKYFSPKTQPDGDYTVKNAREFIGFFNLHRCHTEDAEKIALASSSMMKAHHIFSHFLNPPFVVCKPQGSTLDCQPEFNWKCPIFLNVNSEPSVFCKFTPSSDFGVYIKEFLCPLLVCEVISIRSEADRWCMLIQSIAAARALYFLRRSDTNIAVFVVAIYIRSNLTAERYIVMQTDDSGKVSIAQKDFDLQVSNKSQDFLREMYNLQSKLDRVAHALDDSRKEMLKTVADAARPVTSLSKRKEETKAQSKPENSTEPRGRTLDPVEESGDDFTTDDDIEQCLKDMECTVEGKVLGHPNVAITSHESDARVRGFLKYTTSNSEVTILRHLMSIAGPDNHTISGARVWSRSSGGYIIHTPSGGGHLTDLKRPDDHVWSAAKQLVEGVAFMHKHDVAHLDITPANILIPVDGGRLSINDFSLAMFVNGKTSRGKVGTRGYIAPEVLAEKSDYDPIRADLWSCGKTLEDLISCCNRSTREKDFLAGIAKLLMVDEPQARPMMSEVLAQMESFGSFSVEERPQMDFASPIVVSEAFA